jgi:hypothetical protein
MTGCMDKPSDFVDQKWMRCLSNGEVLTDFTILQRQEWMDNIKRTKMLLGGGLTCLLTTEGVGTSCIPRVGREYVHKSINRQAPISIRVMSDIGPRLATSSRDSVSRTCSNMV